MDTYIEIFCMSLLAFMAGALVLFMVILGISGIAKWWVWWKKQRTVTPIPYKPDLSEWAEIRADKILAWEKRKQAAIKRGETPSMFGPCK